MPTVELSVGSVEYEDTGGSGPTLVLLHGVVMDGSVWDPVVADLRDEFRCIVPTLPLGAHRHPVRADTHLSLEGFGAIVGELLDRLDLSDVTLVGNDHVAALALALERPPRLARLVLSSCELFENYPPGIPGYGLRAMAIMPGGILAGMQLLRLGWVRRLPLAFGWMSKRPLPEELIDRWLRPLQRERAIRRDLRRYAARARRRQMLALCARLPSLNLPTLVVWTPEDRVARPEHGRRLADLLPDARLVEIVDSYTLIMRDQPEALAAAIRNFVATTPPAEGTATEEV